MSIRSISVYLSCSKLCFEKTTENIYSKITIHIIFNGINIRTIFRPQIIISSQSSSLVVACYLAVKVNTESSTKLEPKKESLVIVLYSSSLPPVFRFIWHEELFSVIRFDGIKALMTHDCDVKTPQSVIPGQESVWNMKLINYRHHPALSKDESLTELFTSFVNKLYKYSLTCSCLDAAEGGESVRQQNWT